MELAFIIYLIDNITSMKGSFWGFGDMVDMLLALSFWAVILLSLFNLKDFVEYLINMI